MALIVFVGCDPGQKMVAPVMTQDGTAAFSESALWG